MNPATMKKLVLAYIVAVPLLVLVEAVHSVAVQGAVNSNRRLASADEIIREADNLASNFSQADRALADFLANKKGATLEPFQSSTTQLRASLEHLLHLTRGEAGLEGRLRKLEPAVTATLDGFQKAADSRIKGTSEAAKAPDFFAEAEKQIAPIQAQLVEIKKFELDRLPAYNTVAEETVGRARFIAPIAAVLGVWMVLVAAMLLYRNATQLAWKGIERRIHTRLVETLPFGLCMVDENGLIFFTNPAQDRLFDYQPAELVGRHLATLHITRRGEGEALFAQALQELAERGEWRGDFLARRKNSTTFKCICQAINMELAGKFYRVFLMATTEPQPAA